MYYINAHVHMVSRTTADYVQLAKSGCVAVSEPSFWAGYDRGSVECFRDYFEQITAYEPLRAATYGIRHYSWLCINSKEAENIELAREVIGLIPEFLDRPNVLGIGEIGLNKNTKNEATVFLEQVDLAVANDQLILVHTPHLADKYQGTRMTLDMLTGDSRVQPHRVLIDHVEEHTVKMALDAGFWAAMTLYQTTKGTPERAVDMFEMYGPERVFVNAAGDWGESDPLAVYRRHYRDAPPRPRRIGHPPLRLRQPPRVPRPVPEV